MSIFFDMNSDYKFREVTRDTIYKTVGIGPVKLYSNNHEPFHINNGDEECGVVPFDSLCEFKGLPRQIFDIADLNFDKGDYTNLFFSRYKNNWFFSFYNNNGYGIIKDTTIVGTYVESGGKGFPNIKYKANERLRIF